MRRVFDIDNAVAVGIGGKKELLRDWFQIGKVPLYRRYVADIDLAVAVCVAENGRGNDFRFNKAQAGNRE